MSERRTLDFKLSAVRRMEAGCNVSALARELGVFRAQLYRWHRAWKQAGEAGLRRPGRRPGRQRGGPQAAGAPIPTAPPAVVEEELPAAARARLAELERKVGQPQLELDFFADALRRIAASRRASSAPGATASTPASGR
jgi:transposase-like protein